MGVSSRIHRVLNMVLFFCQWLKARWKYRAFKYITIVLNDFSNQMLELLFRVYHVLESSKLLVRINLTITNCTIHVANELLVCETL